MHDDSFHDRIKDLYRMLFELATGNLSFRLEPAGGQDELARLAQLLGTFAAQFQLAIKKSAHVVPYYSFQSSTQLIFVLDDRCAILAFNSEVPTQLGYSPAQLLSAGFETALAPGSISLWRALLEGISTDTHFHDTVQLVFLTSSEKVFPAFCTVSRLLHIQAIFVTSITTNLQEIAELNRSASVQKPSDAEVTQSLYDYILGNLDKPLPTLKQLAALFRTNEFKLKEGFRFCFKTSIYQFYNDERLKRADLLIQQTELPLKAIALMCGFNDYVNFSKAFKKRFRYAPSDLSRHQG